MSSSTFSSKDEWKVLIVVVGTLLCAEGAVRYLGVSRSQDVRHLEQAGAIVQSLHDEPPPRALFLGNSLTNAGVDVAAFQRGMQIAGGPTVACAKVHPDDTNILDWYYLYRNRVQRPRLGPDVLVVGFAMNQVSDGRTAQPRHLAEMCGWADTSELFANDLLNAGDRVDFLFARASWLYARQETLKHRILSNIIPWYAESHQQLNIRGKNASAASDSVETAPTYKRLDRWLYSLASTNTRAVFVAMPVPDPASQGEPYPLDDSLRDHCHDHGAVLIDARRAPGLESERFYSDGYHLNAAGATLYSEFLGATLADQFRKWAPPQAAIDSP